MTHRTVPSGTRTPVVMLLLVVIAVSGCAMVAVLRRVTGAVPVDFH
jgi:hypothetical protein